MAFWNFFYELAVLGESVWFHLIDLPIDRFWDGLVEVLGGLAGR